jgi:hypothetical protein
MGLDTKTYWLTDRQLQCDFDFELTSLEFWSSTGTAVWPEEKLEDLVCDIYMCYSYSILKNVRTNCSYE